MRHPLHLAICALALASSLGAQENGTVSVASGDSPAGGVDIFVLVNQGKQPVGTTDSQGKLPFDVSLLAGKVRGDAYVQECPSAIRLILVAEGESYHCEEDVGDESCSCKKAGGWLFSNGQIAVNLNAGGASTMAKNPVVIGAAAGGAVTTLLIVGGGGDDNGSSSTGRSTTLTDVGASTPPPVTSTPSPTMLNGTYPGTFVQERDECNFFVNQFTGQAIVQASDGGTLTVKIVENITRIYQGTVMMTSSSTATGQATGNGSIGPYPYNGNLTLTYGNGQLNLLETLRLPGMNDCAAEFRATGLMSQ